MWWITAIILVAILIFIAFICIQAALFNPKPLTPIKEQQIDLIPIDKERAIRNFQEMIKLETLDSNPKARSDFRDLLPKLYPLIHDTLTFEIVGEGGLLYQWKGKSDSHPTVYLSHYDVVPVEYENWTKHPFGATREGGEIWGRGTLDTKSTLLAIMESTETLLASGFVPANDIYFAFGGNAETNSKDAEAIVDLLSVRGIKPALVLDEGGAVVEGVFPGVKSPVATIGIAEKGNLNVQLTANCVGGNAATPPKKTAITALSRAVLRLNEKTFKPYLSPPILQMFDQMGRHSIFPFKVMFGNFWCFKNVFTFLCRVRRCELNSLVRSTIAFTIMETGDAIHVLPSTATIKANIRLIPGDTPQTVVEHLKQTINDNSISVTILENEPVNFVSEINTIGYQRVQDTIRIMWPKALISPFLMMVRTDARHFHKISDVVLRFSAMEMSAEDRERIHGQNERIREEQLLGAVEFYQRMIAGS